MTQSWGILVNENKWNITDIDSKDIGCKNF